MSEVSTQAAQNTIKTYSYLKHMEFYFGAISKKKFRCVVAVTPDMCDVPRSHKSVPVQKKRSIMAVDPTAIEGSVKSAGSDVEEAVL